MTRKLALVSLLGSATLLSACSGIPNNFRVACDNELDAAWRELDIAKAGGFAGTVSYTKAFGLITTARTMQTVENFDGCVKNAQKARFYIRESQAGR
jgi:hypothetical protein